MPRTFYDYDDDGRLVSSWSESEWDEEQVGWLVADERVRRLTGPNGEWLPEATSDAADPMSYSGLQYVVTEGAPFVNWAEKTRLDAVEAYKKQAGKDANLNGLYWPVEKLSSNSGQ